MEFALLRLAYERGDAFFSPASLADVIRNLAIPGNVDAGFDTLVKQGWAVRHNTGLYELTPAGEAKARSFGCKKRRPAF